MDNGIVSPQLPFDNVAYVELAHAHWSTFASATVRFHHCATARVYFYTSIHATLSVLPNDVHWLSPI